MRAVMAKGGQGSPHLLRRAWSPVRGILEGGETDPPGRTWPRDGANGVSAHQAGRDAFLGNRADTSRPQPDPEGGCAAPLRQLGLTQPATATLRHSFSRPSAGAGQDIRHNPGTSGCTVIDQKHTHNTSNTTVAENQTGNDRRELRQPVKSILSVTKKQKDMGLSGRINC